MVARSPPKEKKMAVLNPNLLRETVQKVDRCMARLQELQYTVAGGTKVISGVNLSPRSTRGYLRTSLRCKQESLRIRNTANQRFPKGKMPPITGEWRRMSLPAMLVGETVIEILQASQFAKQVITAVTKATQSDPKTPTVQKNINPSNLENSEMKARRKMEKQKGSVQLDAPSLQRVRSRISFKPLSPPNKREFGKENNSIIHTANRVSPKHRPWAKKTVLFPNPLFHSSSPHQHKFSKTRSPVIANSQQLRFSRTGSPIIAKSQWGPTTTASATAATTPHKFIIKSPPQVKIKNSPSKKKLRKSFSPSKFTNRLVSPLKSRISAQKSLISGLKQRPYPVAATSSMRVATRKF